MDIQRRKILVIDDDAVNRAVLCNILKADYDTVEAENGLRALEILNADFESISLILLDIIMPVMDGFEFLTTLKSWGLDTAAPVIVTTSSDSEDDEIRCLESGATDYVTKPFSPEIVRHRVASIIRLRETSAMLKLLKYDSLTGLYSKESFYQNVSRTLKLYPNDEYDIICSDVKNFKVINELYGERAGDRLLKELAERLEAILVGYDFAGRIGDDVFAACCVRKNNDRHQIDALEAMCQGLEISNVTMKFGIYHVDDCDLPVSAMCDRAILALNRIKDEYGVSVAEYDDSLRLSLLREQQIFDSMEQALENGEIIAYFQPKHDITSGAIIGAEALARWDSPTLGWVQPGEFIPSFETNGFISRLDFYILEQALKSIKDWQRRGLPPFPVSVNLSRADLRDEALTERISALTRQYGIDNSLIHLEITETVYIGDSRPVVKAITQLRSEGFRIEMDDFGKGYSSLNMLSELPIDVLKLDMGFISAENTRQKRSVLRLIISLAQRLGLSTVAEGVETQEQLELLRELGCQSAQGFVFSEPLGKERFEEYIEQNAQKIRPEESFEEYGELEQQTVLLLAEQNQAGQVQKILGPYYELLQAGSIEEAAQLISRSRGTISAVILDLDCVGKKDAAIIDRLHINRDNKKIPIIVSSSAGTRHEELAALRRGAFAYVPKPYEKAILRHELEMAITVARLKKLNEHLERQQKALTDQVYRDPLTGAMNRRGLDEEVQLLSEGVGHAVYLVDVDDFKVFNDTYGHALGDSILKTVYRCIAAEIRSTDILARIGGDEFIIVIESISDAQAALKKGKDICRAIEKNAKRELPVPVSCSIGGCTIKSAASFSEAVKLADRAMYRVKKAGKGGCAIYEQ